MYCLSTTYEKVFTIANFCYNGCQNTFCVGSDYCDMYKYTLTYLFITLPRQVCNSHEKILINCIFTPQICIYIDISHIRQCQLVRNSHMNCSVGKHVYIEWCSLKMNNWCKTVFFLSMGDIPGAVFIHLPVILSLKLCFFYLNSWFEL